MRNEGLYLIAFTVLAIVLLVMVTDSGREHFDPPVDPVIRTTKLEEDVKLLDERTSTLETKLSKQDEDIHKAEADVDSAVTDIQMNT